MTFHQNFPGGFTQPSKDHDYPVDIYKHIVSPEELHNKAASLNEKCMGCIFVTEIRNGEYRCKKITFADNRMGYTGIVYGARKCLLNNIRKGHAQIEKWRNS